MMPITNIFDKCVTSWGFDKTMYTFLCSMVGLSVGMFVGFSTKDLVITNNEEEEII